MNIEERKYSRSFQRNRVTPTRNKIPNLYQAQQQLNIRDKNVMEFHVSGVEVPVHLNLSKLHSDLWDTNCTLFQENH